MNYKLEKFWNADSLVIAILFSSMNYKLEKFWNYNNALTTEKPCNMNYKLEKFWNTNLLNQSGIPNKNEL